MPRLRRLVLVALAAALALSACSGDDGSAPEEGAAEPAPPTLEPAWTADPADLPDAPSDVVVGDGLVVRVGSREIVALDDATGRPVSRWRVPQGVVCRTSPTLGADGVLGLTLSEHRSCRVAAALDLRSGRLRWRTELDVPRIRGITSGDAVSVTDGTLAVVGDCGQVWRMALDDGRPLDRLAPGGRSCFDQQASVTGDRVAVSHVEDAGERRRVVLGLYDLDSGRRLWERRLPDQYDTSVGHLDLADPVLLSASARSVVTTRVWDDRGRPGAPIGKSVLSTLADPEEGYVEVVGRRGDLVVLRYPAGADPDVLRAYDLRTAAELWEMVPPGADSTFTDVLATVDGDRLVVGVSGDEHTDLLGYALDAPGTPQVLGRVPRATSLSGGLVVVGAAAYRLPAEGEERDYRPEPSGRQGEWADTDVRPEQAVEACEAAGDDVPAMLGLEPSDVPPPADCAWYRYRAHGGGVALRVGVHVAEPGRTLDGASVAATDGTRPWIEQAVLTRSGVDLPPLEEGTHLGDEAWGRFALTRETRSDDFRAAMVTRWRNVVVTVSAGEPGRPPASAERLREALFAATEAVLERLGADVPPR